MSRCPPDGFAGTCYFDIRREIGFDPSPRRANRLTRWVVCASVCVWVGGGWVEQSAQKVAAHTGTRTKRHAHTHAQTGDDLFTAV